MAAQKVRFVTNKLRNFDADFVGCPYYLKATYLYVVDTILIDHEILSSREFFIFNI